VTGHAGLPARKQAALQPKTATKKKKGKSRHVMYVRRLYEHQSDKLKKKMKEKKRTWGSVLYGIGTSTARSEEYYPALPHPTIAFSPSPTQLCIALPSAGVFGKIIQAFKDYCVLPVCRFYPTAPTFC